MANHKEQTMTKGNIWKQIIWFSVPLLIGNLFQQLYNTTDSVIVGNFVGKEALAAVGSSGNLINLIIGFFYRYDQRRGRGHRAVLRRQDGWIR